MDTDSKWIWLDSKIYPDITKSEFTFFDEERQKKQIYRIKIPKKIKVDLL